MNSLSDYRQPKLPDVTVRAGQIYVFYDYAEYVLDDRGQLLFSIGNVSDPATVDESGKLYLVEGITPSPGANLTLLSSDDYSGGIALLNTDPEEPEDLSGYLVPSSIVSSYDHAGNLLWNRDIGLNISRQQVARNGGLNYDALPLYANGSLYVPVSNGVASLDTGGDLKWLKQLSGGTYTLFEATPTDVAGNVYLQELKDGSHSRVLAIDRDGQEFPVSWNFTELGSFSNSGNFPRLLAGDNGTVYTTVDSTSEVVDGIEINSLSEAQFLEDLRTGHFTGDTISAYDLRSGAMAWNFTVPAEDVHILTYNQSNYPPNARRSPGDPDYHDEAYYRYFGVSPANVTLEPVRATLIQVSPGSDVTFISLDYDAHEEPVIYNQSHDMYIQGLYAVDRQGKLLWDQQLNGSLFTMVARNGTVYYSTSSGNLGGSSTGIAAGFAAAATLYLFLRFLVIGAVSRARSRLDKNENRNAVLRYIGEHPGETARAISRGLGINLGTLRYHLLILGLNHKIAAHGDEKYQRYFPNSGAYTTAERDLLALMRRDPVRRTLQVLLEKPGISAPELARELDLSTTVTHKHVTLLVRKGVVARTALRDRSYSYAIKEEYQPHVERIARIL